MSVVAHLPAEDPRIAAADPVPLASARRPQTARRGAVLEHQGEAAPRMRRLVKGWAGLSCDLPDGRRQLLRVHIPGDLVGLHALGQRRSPCALTALTALSYIDLGPPPQHLASAGSPAVVAALAALQRALMAHTVRLGQMKADERLADFLLETHQRLLAHGLAGPGSFRLPLTQEVLGELLGLSTAHVNRVLRALTRSGLISLASGYVFLDAPERLARLAGR